MRSASNIGQIKPSSTASSLSSRLFLFCWVLFATGAIASAPRPNIIVILTDDLGYADVGFNGSLDILTPNIDRLAEAGMIFSDAYVAHPFCGPSRAALMTGRYPHKVGAQFNLPEQGSALGVSTEEVFFSKLLNNAGYTTAVVGKWHLGAAAEYHPNKRGFDEFYGFLGGGHEYLPAKYEAEYQKQLALGRTHIWDYLRPLERNGEPVRETEYLTDGLSREAVRFIRSSTVEQAPFFLYLAYNAPHTPLQAKAEDLQRFTHIADSKRRTYAAMVYAVDRGVGKIVEALQDTSSLDNTLLVFFSDNGGRLDEGANNHPLREGKGSVYEGGFRTPMFMHWPQAIPGASRFSHPVSALDFYPLFAALGGAQIPADKKLDGKNIWPSLVSGENPRPGEAIYALRHGSGNSDAAVRRDQWKAVKRGSRPWQLFNIQQDPGETVDLSSKHALILQDLVQGMQQWSWGNQQPHWFHDSATGQKWRADGMPRFHDLFKLD